MDAQKASTGIDPIGLLTEIARRYRAGEAAISFSGAEDVVLIDMAHRAGLCRSTCSRWIPGACIRRPTSTWNGSRKHYGIVIETGDAGAGGRR